VTDGSGSLLTLCCYIALKRIVLAISF